MEGQPPMQRAWCSGAGRRDRRLGHADAGSGPGLRRGKPSGRRGGATGQALGPRPECRRYGAERPRRLAPSLLRRGSAGGRVRSRPMM
eukprot:15439639-Alexandrium_andersonii.AAC.1